MVARTTGRACPSGPTMRGGESPAPRRGSIDVRRPWPVRDDPADGSTDQPRSVHLLHLDPQRRDGLRGVARHPEDLVALRLRRRRVEGGAEEHAADGLVPTKHVRDARLWAAEPRAHPNRQHVVVDDWRARGCRRASPASERDDHRGTQSAEPAQEQPRASGDSACGFFPPAARCAAGRSAPSTHTSTGTHADGVVSAKANGNCVNLPTVPTIGTNRLPLTTRKESHCRDVVTVSDGSPTPPFRRASGAIASVTRARARSKNRCLPHIRPRGGVRGGSRVVARSARSSLARR